MDRMEFFRSLQAPARTREMYELLELLSSPIEEMVIAEASDGNAQPGNRAGN